MRGFTIKGMRELLGDDNNVLLHLLCQDGYTTTVSKIYRNEHFKGASFIVCM